MSEANLHLILEGIASALLGIVALGVLQSLRPIRRSRPAELGLHEKLDRLIQAKRTREELRQRMAGEPRPDQSEHAAPTDVLHR